MKQLASTRITFEAFGGMLLLPADRRVVGVFMTPEDIIHGTMTIVIEGEGLPTTPAGCAPCNLRLREISG